MGFVSHLKTTVQLLLAILSLAACWNSCFIPAREYETWSFHLLKVRPLSPIIILLGYAIGISFAFFVIFLGTLPALSFVGYRNYQNLHQDEQASLQKTFFSPKILQAPEAKDYSALVERELKNQIRIGLPDGYTPEFMRKEIENRIFVRNKELIAQDRRRFHFTGIADSNNQLHLQVLIGGSFSNPEERIGNLKLVYINPETQQPHFKNYMFLHQKELIVDVPDLFVKDGELFVYVENNDINNRAININNLMVSSAESSFVVNGLTILLYLFLTFFVLSLVGASVGLIFSFPVALFCGVSYILVSGMIDLKLLPDHVQMIVDKFVLSIFNNPICEPFGDGVQVDIISTQLATLTLLILTILFSVVGAMTIRRRQPALTMRRQ